MNQNIFLAVCVCGSMMNCLGRSCLPLGSPGGMFRAFKTSFQQGCHHKVSSQNIFLIFFWSFSWKQNETAKFRCFKSKCCEIFAKVFFVLSLVCSAPLWLGIFSWNFAYSSSPLKICMAVCKIMVLVQMNSWATPTIQTSVTNSNFL